MATHPTGMSALLAPGRTKLAHGDGKHFVQFYGEDQTLVESVQTFVSGGLTSGALALVVATPAHRLAIAEALETSGFDLEAERATGSYVELDAAETLRQFMVDGMPDPVRFNDVVVPLIIQATATGREMRIYGEMVAVLWDEGNLAGALALEELWNETARVHNFQLFCGYPSTALVQGHLDEVTAICHEHTHVLPPN